MSEAELTENVKLLARLLQRKRFEASRPECSNSGTDCDACTCGYLEWFAAYDALSIEIDEALVANIHFLNPSSSPAQERTER